jgi:glycerol-3-phosphate dehydrogenase (NAD(P)+)
MDLVVVATPMRALRQVLTDVAPWVQARVPVVWLCKGFEAGADGMGRMGHEVCALVAPQLLGGVLSGPSFAQEVAMGQPAALVAASAHTSVRETLVQAFHRGNLRVYANADVVGVEVGGAVKNVLAIATGLCDGLKLGLNARAALITRGLAEMTRLGVALGAHPETFMGLSGLGDLVLTCTDDQSRNRRFGLALGRGASVEQAQQEIGLVEGAATARALEAMASRLRVDTPIAQAVAGIVRGEVTPAATVVALMSREPATETDSA